MLIELEDGSFLNSDLISRVASLKSQDGEKRVRLHCRDDSEYCSPRYADDALDDVIAAVNGTIIKAEPGYRIILHSSKYEGGDFWYRESEIIIAWLICPGSFRSPRPITPGCVQDETLGGYAILCPDGRVAAHDGGSYPNLAEWEEDTRHHLRMERERWMKEPKPSLEEAVE